MGHVGAYVPRKFLPTSRFYLKTVIQLRLKNSKVEVT